MRERTYLFNKLDWFAVDKHQRKKLVEEIEDLDGNRLLNTSIDDLCEYFENKYRIDVPVLDRDGIIADQHETQIDVSQDSQRCIRDRSRPFMIAGTVIEISIPFNGDAGVFLIEPSSSTLNPPFGEVRNGTIVLCLKGTDLQPEKVKDEIDHNLAKIESYLTNLRRNVQGLNEQLRSIAREAIERRCQKLLSDRSLVSSLGFKIKERQNAPQTYVAPEVQRKISPSLPPTSSAPFKPEPVLSSSDYDHILGVIQNMAYVMERSPSASRQLMKNLFALISLSN